jgi:uncharacterized protein (DUF302 family)
MPRNAYRAAATLWLAVSFAALLPAVALAQDTGLVTRTSPHGVAETIEKIDATAKARGMTVFARIDHSGAAKAAGLEMRPTQVIILGNPKGGTPIMLAAPSAALDLPLRVLVAQDADGRTLVTFNDHRWLAARHKLAEDQVKPLAGLPGLLDAALQ